MDSPPLLPSGVPRMPPSPAPFAGHNSTTTSNGDPRDTTEPALSPNADPDWWKEPISREQARVLRRATGLVLRDAIRFYRSGKATQDDIHSIRRDPRSARNVVDVLQRDGVTSAKQLENIVSDFDKRYDLQQAFLADIQRGMTLAKGQSDHLAEICAEVMMRFNTLQASTLPALKRDNKRLHALLGSVTADVELLRQDLHQKFRADSTMVEPGALEPGTSTGHGIEIGFTANQCKQVVALLKDAERDYLVKRPGSDTTFIWEFIESIEDDQLCRDIQMSLARLVDEKLVQKARPRRGKEKRRVVTISPKLTWRQFAHALWKLNKNVS